MKTTSLVQITGNTYPVKDQLKALGARWNGENKCWMIDAAKADEALEIVAGSKSAPARRRYTGAPTSYRSLSRPGVQAKIEASWNRREDRFERANGIGI